MSIKKTFLKSKPAVKIVFEIAPEQIDALGISLDDVVSVELLCDAFSWTPKPFKALKGPRYKITENFPTDGEPVFQYRYRLTLKSGASVYFNEPDAADGYCDNGMGEENTLLAVEG